MADILLMVHGQLPPSVKIKYKDMSDGTHALVVALVSI